MPRKTEEDFLKTLTSYGVQVCERLTAIRKSRTWLAKEMGVTPKTLCAKMQRNTFSVSEKHFLKTLLGMNERDFDLWHKDNIH